MRQSPPDLTPVIVALIAALVFALVACQLYNWFRTRAPRLRLLTGTGGQRAALALALAPVMREFLPPIGRAGQDVRAIVVVPTLTGTDGEPLVAELEQLSGSSTFVVRLAHRLRAVVRQPEDVAGALAENLLFLYRQAAAVTVIRQTVGTAGPAAAASTSAKPASRNGLAALPNHATHIEAEGTVVQFKPSPSGPRNGQGA